MITALLTIPIIQYDYNHMVSIHASCELAYVNASSQGHIYQGYVGAEDPHCFGNFLDNVQIIGKVTIVLMINDNDCYLYLKL